MKASTIKNNALAEILDFARYELSNIVNHRIAIGEVERNNLREYEEDVFGYDLPETKYYVWVEHIGLKTEGGFVHEQRTLKSFYLFDGAVYVQSEEDEKNGLPAIALRSLDFDSIVELTDVLETMWNKIIKS